MDLLIVIFSAIAAWAVGSVYYMFLAGPWVRLSGVKVDNRGNPEKASAAPYLISGAAMLIVALMIRYLFDIADINDLWRGLLHGAAIGGFIVTPWVLINHTKVQRPFRLALIDGGYAVLACAVIGAIMGAT